MGQPVDDDPGLSFDCFRDFVVGYTLRDIGNRHNIEISVAEERLRRGLYDFGFSEAVLKRISGKQT
jgi:hypothetical protein